MTSSAARTSIDVQENIHAAPTGNHRLRIDVALVLLVLASLAISRSPALGGRRAVAASQGSARRIRLVRERVRFMPGKCQGWRSRSSRTARSCWRRDTACATSTRKLPVTPKTLFAIGSCTKAFTTFLMGTLVDEGKLDWDKPVRTYLAELPSSRPGCLRADHTARSGHAPVRPAPARPCSGTTLRSHEKGDRRPASIPRAQRNVSQQVSI